MAVIGSLMLVEQLIPVIHHLAISWLSWHTKKRLWIDFHAYLHGNMCVPYHVFGENIKPSCPDPPLPLESELSAMLLPDSFTPAPRSESSSQTMTSTVSKVLSSWGRAPSRSIVGSRSATVCASTNLTMAPSSTLSRANCA